MCTAGTPGGSVWDEITAFQTRRATYITFPSNLQAILGVETSEDTLRGDEWMGDEYTEDEARVEAYMLMNENQSS